VRTDVAPVRIHLRIEAADCGGAAPSCRTALHQADNTILVMVSADACGDGACAPAEVDCFPGALPAGTYGVSVNGAPPRYSFAIE
jgi:hypothetical protein